MSLVLLNHYLITLGWIFALVIILSVAFPILIVIVDKLFGKLDVIKELKRKNLAVAILMAAIILGVTLIISLSL